MSQYQFPFWDDLDYWKQRNDKLNKIKEDDGYGETCIED